MEESSLINKYISDADYKINRAKRDIKNAKEDLTAYNKEKKYLLSLKKKLQERK